MRNLFNTLSAGKYSFLPIFICIGKKWIKALIYNVILRGAPKVRSRKNLILVNVISSHQIVISTEVQSTKWRNLILVTTPKASFLGSREISIQALEMNYMTTVIPTIPIVIVSAVEGELTATLSSRATSRDLSLLRHFERSREISKQALRMNYTNTVIVPSLKGIQIMERLNNVYNHVFRSVKEISPLRTAVASAEMTTLIG